MRNVEYYVNELNFTNVVQWDGEGERPRVLRRRLCTFESLEFACMAAALSSTQIASTAYDGKFAYDVTSNWETTVYAAYVDGNRIYHNGTY